MGRHSKYNPGDRLGPYSILFVQRTRKNSNGDWYGVFECPFCGKKWEAKISNVVSGNTSSCGCRCSKDLTNQRFGKLIVLCPTKQRESSGHIVWECKCDCGNITYVPTSNLLNGHTQSCGCLKTKFQSKDIAGQRFDKLLVIRPTNQRKNGCVVWECKCDCGNITYVSYRHLAAGDTSSCGCIASKGEQKISQILRENDIVFEQQKTFDGCHSDKNYPLRFDFYLPDYNTCIEYDGKQHFKPIEYFGGEEVFKRQQENDQIKNNYCTENNIRLIRISDCSDEALNNLIKEIRKEKVC